MKKTILFAAAALALAACGKKEQPAAETSAQPVTAQAAVLPAGSYQKKQTYFKLPGASGGEIDLASYAGKPLMLMFFTEGCPFCRKAGPELERLYNSYSKKGMNFVGICIQDDKDAPLGFAKDLGITFPLAYGGRAVYKAYKAQGVPYIYLLDRDHKIVNVWEGYDESYAPEMVKGIEGLLGKK